MSKQIILRTSKLLVALLLWSVFFHGVGTQTTYAENDFAGGEGTVDSPYLIETADELNKVRNHLNSHFKLISDIDLNEPPFNTEEGWEPIGDKSSPFTGTFDGGDFPISNLTMNREGHFQGLFGVVGTSGMVQNTLLENVQINGISESDHIGGLVGENRGTIKNSSVVDGKVMGRSYIGGLVGMNKGVIMNSFTSITVVSNGSRAGGLAGRSIASVGVPASISNSYAKGEIRGGTTVGGLIGSNWFEDGGESEIINSYATGDVSGTGKYVGGLIGHNSAKTHGTIEITNSYATGNVVGTDEYVGGLIGVNDAYGKIVINNSYAIGKVSGTQTKIGGLVGGHSINDNGTIETYHSYWDIDLTGQETSAAGEGKNSEDMKQSDKYTSWDFDNIWYQYDGQTTPFLQWQNPIEKIEAIPAKDKIVFQEQTQITTTAIHEQSTYDVTLNAEYSVTQGQDVIEVDNQGLVTSKGLGEATIRVSVHGQTTTVDIVVGDEAKLSGLSLSSGAMDPVFSPDVTAYTAQVAYPTSEVEVFPEAEYPTTIIEVNGENVPSDQPSEAIPLVVGDNEIEIIAITEKGIKKTYTITIHRQQRVSGGGGSVPTLPPPSNVIPPNGGTLELEGVTIVFPIDAVEEGTVIHMETYANKDSLPLPEATFFLSEVFEITKDSLGDFKQMITLTLPFSETIIDFNNYDIAIFWLDEESNTWVKLENTKIDLETGTVSGDVNHFTKFAILAIEKSDEEIEFSDIGGHWAEDFIQQATTFDIFKGYPDGTFKPNNYLTRAQIASLLVRALGLETNEVSPFGDIGGYAKETQAEIHAAYKFGLIKGQNGNFTPSENITRAQIALMLKRAYEYKTGVEYIAIEKAPYSDFGSYDEETVNAISMLYELGIANGSDGKYRPNNPTTRAQAAKIFVGSYRLLQQEKE